MVRPPKKFIPLMKSYRLPFSPSVRWDFGTLDNGLDGWNVDTGSIIQLNEAIQLNHGDCLSINGQNWNEWAFGFNAVPTLNGGVNAPSLFANVVKGLQDLVFGIQLGSGLVNHVRDLNNDLGCVSGSKFSSGNHAHTDSTADGNNDLAYIYFPPTGSPIFRIKHGVTRDQLASDLGLDPRSPTNWTASHTLGGYPNIKKPTKLYFTLQTINNTTTEYVNLYAAEVISYG